MTLLVQRLFHGNLCRPVHETPLRKSDLQWRLVGEALSAGENNERNGHANLFYVPSIQERPQFTLAFHNTRTQGSTSYVVLWIEAWRPACRPGYHCLRCHWRGLPWQSQASAQSNLLCKTTCASGNGSRPAQRLEQEGKSKPARVRHGRYRSRSRQCQSCYQSFGSS